MPPNPRRQQQKRIRGAADQEHSCSHSSRRSHSQSSKPHQSEDIGNSHHSQSRDDHGSSCCSQSRSEAAGFDQHQGSTVQYYTNQACLDLHNNEETIGSSYNRAGQPLRLSNAGYNIAHQPSNLGIAGHHDEKDTDAAQVMLSLLG